MTAIRVKRDEVLVGTRAVLMRYSWKKNHPGIAARVGVLDGRRVWIDDDDKYITFLGNEDNMRLRVYIRGRLTVIITDHPRPVVVRPAARSNEYLKFYYGIDNEEK